MPRSQRAQRYEDIAEQASLAETGGLAKPRSVLLLWFLRNVVGIGDLEAYDHVCDGDNDMGIDGLFVEKGAGDEQDGLVIYQSKYTESPAAKVGPTDLDRLAGAANYFKNEATLTQLQESAPEPALLHLISGLDLKSALLGGHLAVRLVLVTTGQLNADAKRKVAALQEAHGRTYIDVWDVDRLGPLAAASRSPKRLQASIAVTARNDETLIAGRSPRRVAVVPVNATEIVFWPGIESRELFALNVRHELRANRVSRALDDAINRPDEHETFLAYHNGLTVVCDNFRRRAGRLHLKNPSVVNGAQSVLAFKRAEAAGTLSAGLRVFVKVVEVKGRPHVEREVARRSNTQTGVNPRNLMANHGSQLRILREFEERYPSIAYETRPDTIAPQGQTVIKNDEAAQLLCAIFNEWPWLAVKKNSLFESENHPHIFSERIHAHHIIFADRIKAAIQDQKDEFPDEYRSSWLLTRLVACYLVGQTLRSAGPLTDPVSASAQALAEPALLASLSSHVTAAAVTMSERHEDLGDKDDFKKDFKNERELRSVGVAARKTYRLMQKIQARS